jgi:glucosamine--fructose-6-phosphate aminotransferase (isomerizing)
MALVRANFPLLIFTQDDESRAGVVQLAGELVRSGAAVLIAGAEVAQATVLPSETAHPVIEPLLQAQSFYRLVNALSLERGRDPDRPPNLSKVTETL